ncbi:DUF6985 domain-containing protein [Vibrio nigripulchritudo]|uniref:DUF6985 domain-containing protein n=1 Tax=Vibrio nigripulchritudo TaxID=28173 RepID=UPI0003B1C15E|nr:hypothetical protein [Vibrio nigripulchritudo]CCN73312.1 hypothetical protein VIBNISFn118_800010 [Vibrio nigripulchritudo SFn118]
MHRVNDEVFGELVFRGTWKSNIIIPIFGKEFPVILIVEDNDDDTLEIRKEQKDSFLFYLNNKVSILDKVENFTINFTKEYLIEYGNSSKSNEFIVDSIRPTALVFPMVLDDNDINFGFLFETKFDPEGGIGVQYLNGEYEVSTQDILT